MDGNNRRPPVAMSKKMMASFDSDDVETSFLQRGNQILAADTG
jgi:hypothetical protein